MENTFVPILNETYEHIYCREGRHSYPLTYALASKMVKEGMAFVKSPGAIVRLTREEIRNAVFAREEGFCYFCGAPGNDTTLLVSKSKGGYRSVKNSVCACLSCKTLDSVARLRQIDRNPRRLRGSYCRLYKVCRSCSKVKHRKQFPKPSTSICKDCFQRVLSLKKLPEQLAAPKKRKKPETGAELISLNIVRKNHRVTIAKGLSYDLKMIDKSREHFYQVLFNNNDYKLVDYQLAKMLIEERFCGIVPYYPYVLVTLFSQNYKNFRQQILNRDHYICYYCGQFGETVDHKTPKSLGGLTSPKNCVCACYSCNSAKKTAAGDWEPQSPDIEIPFQLE